MVDPSEPPHDLTNRGTSASRPSRRSDAAQSHDARTDDRRVDSEWIKPTAPRHGGDATEGPNDRTSSGNDAAPTGEDFRRNRAKLSTNLADIDHRDAPQDPRSTSQSREPPEPPWKRSKQPQAFAGDIAAVELRNRLALAPDRLPPPPSPGSISSTFASAGRLIAVTMVAAVGFIGYRWGSAPPTSTSQRQFTLPSNRADLASEQSLPAYLSSPSLDSKSPAVRPAGNAALPASSPGQSVSLAIAGKSADQRLPGGRRSAGATAPLEVDQARSPGKLIAGQSRGRDSGGTLFLATLPGAGEARSEPDPSFAARTHTAEVGAQPQRESAESGTSLPPEPAPAILREDRERALKLKQKGDEQLTQGLIAPARLLYDRAADLGLTQAALALAATYDETAPAHSNLRGVGSDPRAAAHWYERARLLAARDADR